jgi:antitoxin YefM
MYYSMYSTYSVTKAQSALPRLLKDAAKSGTIAITRHDETVAYLVSRERMEAIVETLDILGNSAAMRAVHAYRQGKMKFQPLEDSDHGD